MAIRKQLYNEKISQRIKEERKNKGLSRQKLAAELVNLAMQKIEYDNISVSLSAVKSWEGIGRKYSPDNTTLQALSDIFGVRFYYLKGIDDWRTDSDWSKANINTSDKDGGQGG